MRQAKVFSQKVVGWQLLADALSAELSSKPHLQALYDDLVDVIEEAHLLQANQETPRAQLLDTIRQRQKVEVRGDGIRSRLSSFLRGELGPKNLQLVRYGVPPLPRSRRQEPGAEPPPPPPVETQAPDGEADRVSG